MDNKDKYHWMSNNVYDAFKFVAQIVLPALGTLYFALSQIWGFPYGEEVVGTITAIDIFLGVILGISTKGYNNLPDNYDGTLGIAHGEGEKDTAVLSMSMPIEELKRKDSISLRVRK